MDSKRHLTGEKQERNWHGPCEIVEHTSRGTYRLHNQQAFSSSNLKVYNGPKEGQAKKGKSVKQEEPKKGQELQKEGKGKKGRKRVSTCNCKLHNLVF